ncbi:hypothetical protein HYH03_003573 [Edaphochlamys debaryana]|uniref:Serine/threonine-protein kinase n=1 Tax=Edaphochlamys debaryana TaxID=47281 RepID=A0A836C416_9CHLO|nr:hypothetical protein HYH03_003573 [Edaphochlamys debaryana]|eukprot:KAG2498312.1 hypothetical protein HYH03_003573 [Edaphochlamys debaryana]
MDGGSVAAPRVRGPKHGPGRIWLDTFATFSLDLTTSWSLTSPDRIVNVTVCCEMSQEMIGMQPQPQQLRLMTARGAVLKVGNDDVPHRYGTVYTTTCSDWEPVPPGFLLAGVSWMKDTISIFEGFSGRAAFIFAEPSPNAWFYTSSPPPPPSLPSPPPQAYPDIRRGGSVPDPGFGHDVEIATIIAIVIPVMFGLVVLCFCGCFVRRWMLLKEHKALAASAEAVAAAYRQQPGPAPQVMAAAALMPCAPPPAAASWPPPSAEVRADVPSAAQPPGSHLPTTVFPAIHLNGGTAPPATVVQPHPFAAGHSPAHRAGQQLEAGADGGTYPALRASALAPLGLRRVQLAEIQGPSSTESSTLSQRHGQLTLAENVRRQFEVLSAGADPMGAPGPMKPSPCSAPEMRLYAPHAIQAATQGFSEARLVGRGPSGSAVYRGELDGAAVAVKRMGPAAPGAVGPDLEAAARVLASLQLPHVLRVLGCCPEQHVIVYDWAFGGSLEGRLSQGGPGLGWKDRVRVAAEAGTGLALLHGLTPLLTHGSLHPRNVLLDGEGRAQLADVGLGTAAQEGGGAGPEGDVHALGVLMLRLLGVGGSEGDVLARARAAQSDPTLSALVGSGRAGGDWPSPESLGFAHLALKCVGPDPGSRPDLRFVVLPALLQLHNRTRLYGDGPAGPAAAAALPQEGEEEEGDAPTNIPAGFVCPITQELMADPCVAADGFSYERIAIQEWTSRFTAAGHPARSPLTNLPLEHPHVVPNNFLRQQIRQWQDEK